MVMPLDVISSEKKPFLYTVYTARKVRIKTQRLCGPIHGSMDGERTVCGKTINCHWYILNNTFDGNITCGECLAALVLGIHGRAWRDLVESARLKP